MDQLDLIDICRAFHHRTMDFTIFSSAHRTYSRTDYILGHKSNFGKFKKLDSFQASFLITMQKDQTPTTEEKKKPVKNTNIWMLNNTLMNNQQIIEEIKEEIKLHIETHENENTTIPNLWD